VTHPVAATVETNGDEQPTKTTPTATTAVAADTIKSVSLRLRLDGRGLFGLQRALAWLRENCKDLQVEVTVRAAPPEQGLDRARFRNGVLEPLEEGYADVTDAEIL
jgi:hypothetical protein